MRIIPPFIIEGIVHGPGEDDGSETARFTKSELREFNGRILPVFNDGREVVIGAAELFMCFDDCLWARLTISPEHKYLIETIKLGLIQGLSLDMMVNTNVYGSKVKSLYPTGVAVCKHPWDPQCVVKKIF